ARAAAGKPVKQVVRVLDAVHDDGRAKLTQHALKGSRKAQVDAQRIREHATDAKRGFAFVVSEQRLGVVVDAFTLSRHAFEHGFALELGTALEFKRVLALAGITGELRC